VTSPYREAPQYLQCPRCSEALDRAFTGVAVCPRCQGAWIEQATLDTAFGNPRWPPGQDVWWQDDLECPECAAVGARSKLSARSSNGVMVDACSAHGVWLDRGELGRLMSLATDADELLELRRRIAAVADPDGLRRRRQAWRAEIEAQRRDLHPKRRDGDPDS
jgi:Zn-finger nucleic acid-binding protein